MGFIWDDTKADDAKFTAHIITVTKSLTDTRDGLLADMAKLKVKLKEYDGIDPAEFKKIKDELEVLKNNAGEGDSEVTKQFKVLKEQYDNLAKVLTEMSEEKKKFIVDDEITKSLVSVKVDSEMLESAILIIKSKVAVVKENGKDVAKVGDKTIAEYVKEWAETPTGKKFTLASNNTGGDGGSDDDGGNNQTESNQAKYFDKTKPEHNVTKQIMLKKTNPTLYAKLAKKFKK